MFSNPQKNLLQISVAKGAIVADLDCGIGHYALEVAKLTGEHGEVYAIDINEELLKKIVNEAKKEKLKNLHVICANIEKRGGTTLKDSSVDLVIMANTFFAVSDKKGAIEEVKRILRPKGRILFVEWKDSFAGVGPHRDHVFKQDDAEKLFAEENLEIVNEIVAGDHHYGLVLRKK